ncbi:MAG: hypothetical protein LLG04_14170 [Parachlamydia sp.]|nr:hypothetical protein [Parachlamydia sp.]
MGADSASIGGEAHQKHIVHLEAPIPVSPKTGSVAPGDTVESIKDKAHPKEKRADTPDLAEAEWLLWWAASTNQFMLVSASGAADSSGVSGIDFGGRRKHKSAKLVPGLVLLQQGNALMEIGVKVLNAWSKSLKEEAAAVRRELKSDRHQDLQAQRGKAGFEAYLHTLTPEQREQVLLHSRLERLAKIDEGIAQGLGDYLSRVKADPNANLPFMLGTLAIGASVRFDAASGSHVAAGGQTLVNPVGGVADNVLPKVIPTYSVELGAIGSMFGVGAVYFTMGQTVAKGVSPTEPSFNHKFAKNYAQQVIETIKGSEFTTLAAAMVTAQAAEGEPLSRERQQQLINALKIVMLSAAVILLYKTESAFKGQGGGMTELEFAFIVNGKTERKDLAADLGSDIKQLLGTLPKAEANALYSGLLAYVASNPKMSTLLNFDSVFTSVGKGIATPELSV